MSSLRLLCGLNRHSHKCSWLRSYSIRKACSKCKLDREPITSMRTRTTLIQWFLHWYSNRASLFDA